MAKDPLTALEGIFYFLGLGLVDPEGEKVRSPGRGEGYNGGRRFTAAHVSGRVEVDLNKSEPEPCSFFGDSTPAELGGY